MGQALRFAIVGVSNTLLDLALFSLLVSAGAPIPLANVLSYCSGLAWSFALNGRWTFRDGAARGGNGLSSRTALRFVAVGILSLGLSTALVTIFDIWVSAILAKVLTIPFVFVFGFAMSKLFVFQTRALADAPHENAIG